MNFEFILNHAPEVAQLKFEGLSALRERKDFHPEESAAEHIKIVTNRCIASNDADLIMTGFFHDIFKAETARINPKTGYPTSPGHDAAAAKFIRENNEVKDMILKFKGNPENVTWLCEQHMRIAQFDVMKKSKQDALSSHYLFDKLLAFHSCDNMLISDEIAIAKMFDCLGIDAK